VSLDLASYNVVEDNLEFLKKIVKDYVDIVFANEEEAKSFTGKEPEESIHVLGDLCEYAIVKVGKDGSMIKHKGRVTKVESIKAKSIDTTGAGDLYAAGFLCGLINEYDLKKCGQIGSILAGKTIEVVGPKMSIEKWDEVRQMITEL
jgi:sugar/nucleoside kinase (ribokinase family)